MGREEYIILPFLSLQDNLEYARNLTNSIDAFRNVRTPIARPKLPSNIEIEGRGVDDQPTTDGDGSGLTAGAMIGISCAAAISVALVAGLVIGRNWRKCVRRESRYEDDSPEPTSSEPAPSQDGSTMTPSSGAATPEAIAVDVTGSPNHLPTLKDQTRSVNYGPQAPAVAHVISERVTQSPTRLPSYKDQTRGS